MCDKSAATVDNAVAARRRTVAARRRRGGGGAVRTKSPVSLLSPGPAHSPHPIRKGSSQIKFTFP